MSCAVGSTWPSGGRRNTQLWVPSEIEYVRFERPPAIRVAVSGASSAPSTFAAKYGRRRSRSTPSGVVVPMRAGTLAAGGGPPAASRRTRRALGDPWGAGGGGGGLAPWGARDPADPPVGAGAGRRPPLLRLPPPQTPTPGAPG